MDSFLKYRQLPNACKTYIWYSASGVKRSISERQLWENLTQNPKPKPFIKGVYFFLEPWQKRFAMLAREHIFDRNVRPLSYVLLTLMLDTWLADTTIFSLLT